MRRTTLALALAALLVVAGCASVDVGDSPTPDAADTDVPESEGTTSETPIEKSDTPQEEGVYGRSISDGRSVAEIHASELEAAGSFTYRASAAFEVSDRARQVNRTVRVSGDELAVRTWSRWFDGRSYVDGNEAYSRIDRNGEVDTRRHAGSLGDASGYTGAAVDSLLASATFTYRKEGIIGDAEGSIYVATGEDVDIQSVENPFYDPAEIENVRLLLVINERGIIERLEYRETTVDGRRAVLDVEYVEIGSTDVARQGWVSDVRDGDTNDDQRLPKDITESFRTRAAAAELFGLVDGSSVVNGYDGFDAALVSGIVFRESGSSTDIELAFDQEAVADAEPEEYVVYRYDRETGELIPVDSQLAGQNTRRLSATRGVYMILHRPTYEGERNG